MTPTVTVVIPTYNRARYLPDALASVFAQSRAVDEVLVVDDGSTDDTSEVMKSYGAPVRYLRQKNAGPGAARNYGFREARSDYIALLDSDDLWVPDKIEKQLGVLRAYPEVDFLFGDMTIFSKDKNSGEPEIKIPSLHDYFVQNSPNLKEFIDCLVVENMVPTSSVMYRRSCIERVGFFDQQLRIAEDLEYWLRVALHCRCAFVDAVLVKRRRHEGNLINNWAECNQCHAEVLERATRLQPGISQRARTLIKKKLGGLYYDLGSYHLKRKEIVKSHSCFRMGSARHPFDVKWFFKFLISSPFIRRA